MSLTETAFEEIQDRERNPIPFAVKSALDSRTFAHKAQLTLILTYLYEKKYKEAIIYIKEFIHE